LKALFDLNYKQLQKDIKNGLSAKEIKVKWQKGIEQFKQVRRKYLLY